MNRLSMCGLAMILMVASGCIPEATQRPSLVEQCNSTPSFCMEEGCPGQIVIPQGLPEGAFFGASVAIDGEWLAVGAPGIQSVFVYRLNSETKQWEQRHIIASGDGAQRPWFPDGIEPGRSFGSRVTLQDGWLAIGEPTVVSFDDVYRDNRYVYAIRVDVLDDPEQSVLSVIENPDGGQFGTGLVVSQNVLYASSTKLSYISLRQRSRDDGYALTFELPELMPSSSRNYTIGDAQDGSLFGFAMTAQDDVTAVTAPYFDLDGADNVGAIYIFERGFTPVNSSAPKEDSLFGFSISSASQFLVVGAPSPSGSNGGAIEFFKRENDQYVSVSLNDGTGRLGYSVASHQGYAIAGAPEDGRGSVTLFANVLCDSPSRLNIDANTIQGATLTQYGYDVGYTKQWVVVGAPASNSNAGAVHVIPVIE